MTCPVQSAIREIRGGWDDWEEDEGITIDGQTYVCANAAFFYTTFTLQHAREQLGGKDHGELLRPYIGKTRSEVFAMLSPLLQRPAHYFDLAINSLERSISKCLELCTYYSFKYKKPMMVGWPEVDWSTTHAIVSSYIEFSKCLGAEITPLPPPSVDSADAKITESDAFASVQNIIRGIGRKEGEYLAAIKKIQQVEKAVLAKAEEVKNLMSK
jgi:hypothetical protein